MKIDMQECPVYRGVLIVVTVYPQMKGSKNVMFMDVVCLLLPSKGQFGNVTLSGITI